MSVNAAGAISSGAPICNPTPECSYTGAVAPRPDGHNIFNVSVTVTGTACAAAGSYSGVAYQTGIRLHLFAINAQRTRVLNRQLDRYYMCT